MFCVLYQWKVKPGKEETFRETWRTITQAIFHQHGSLGSRLHQDQDGTFIAYAQWPDREHWEKGTNTLGVELAHTAQDACLEEPLKVLMTLTVTDDMLKQAPYNKAVEEQPIHSPETGPPKIRVARPTDKMDEVVRFYRDGLGFDELGRFADHEGFDGVMLGSSGGLYHLEFTSCKSHAAGRAPTQDNLLVYYVPEKSRWTMAIDRMKKCGYAPVKSFNPYWDKEGATFEDPDGYRVVLQNAAWEE